MRSLGIGLAWNKLGSFLAQGVAYFTEGRVLDYSTDVGPFTIVDQSDEGNTATLYSGRGATIGPAANTITYPTGYGSAERTATVWMRVDVLGARTLNGATGTFTFTPTATGIWEQLSSTATVSGNLSWTPGSDCDISDLTCATEHWTHDDFSNPTGDTSNGKTIVDSGPNQLHGTCTGCAGFTGEGIDPEVANIVGLDNAQWFNGVDTSVSRVGFIPINGTQNFVVKCSFASTLDGVLINQASGTFADDGWQLIIESPNRIRLKFFEGGNPYLFTLDTDAIYFSGDVVDVRVIVNRSANADLWVNGSFVSSTDISSVPSIASTQALRVGSKNGTSFQSLNGIIFDIGLYDGLDQSTPLFECTGLGDNPWLDTSGNGNDLTPSGDFVTVGQKRATIPQTADRNWNKYQWFNDSDTIVDMTSTVILTSSAWFVEFRADGDGVICGKNSADGEITLTATNVGLRPDGQNSGFINLPASYAAGDLIKVDVPDSSLNSWDLYVNDVFIGTGVAPNLSISQFSVDRIGAGAYGGTKFLGLLWDVSINGVAAYTGLGNDPWKDTSGNSNDGTESGTFTRQLVLASDANDQIDAYGTAILEPRTNAQVVNIFAEGELVKTPAAASLDTIKTVSGWIWHDGTARTVIDLGTPTVGTTATDLTSSGFTGVTYFVNGQSGTTLSDGWNHCVVASTAALATDDIDILAKSGSSIDYITTLTVAEALQNFDAQKALYNISNGAVLPATLPATL